MTPPPSLIKIDAMACKHLYQSAWQGSHCHRRKSIHLIHMLSEMQQQENETVVLEIMYLNVFVFVECIQTYYSLYHCGHSPSCCCISISQMKQLDNSSFVACVFHAMHIVNLLVAPSHHFE